MGLENSGYDDADMITNLGFLFIVIMLTVANSALLPFIYILKAKFYRFTPLYDRLHSMIFWNGFLRFILEGYLELLINCLINLNIMLDTYHSEGYILNY